MDWNKTIFLAHAKEDKPFVRKLYTRLKAEGLEPWLDEESLDPGVKWDDKIKEAIKKSRFFLACISSHSVEKNGYVQRELKLALTQLEEKAPSIVYFIPVLLEEGVELPNISVSTTNLTDYQAIKIFTEDGMLRLVQYLKKQVGILEEVKKQEKPGLDKIRNAIAQGQIEKALETLQEYVQNKDGDLYNNVIMLMGRFNSLKQQDIKGIIPHDEYSIQSNRIVYSILETLKILETN